MVHVQGYLLMVVGFVLAVVENGLSLRCWKCSSEQDATCRDYFNTTRILINQRNSDTYNYGSVQSARTEPHMTECEGMHTSTFGQYKNVCLKRVIAVTNGLGPNQVTRECRMVSKDLKIGTCPEDLLYGSNSKNLVHCGTCEMDGCNSASKNALIFVGLVPAVLMLLGKW